MNIAVSYQQPAAPSTRSLMERALDPYILVGMPHLTPVGLSQTWLLKELGHRHWMMLALRLGMDDANFRTPDGREAYASICATSLEQIDGGLHIVRPNDVLEIVSSFCFLPRHRHSSRHRLKIGGRQIGEVELVSTFVARETEADNHSLARVETLALAAQHFGVSELSILASAMRKDAGARKGAGDESGCHIDQARFSPIPEQDFNGAGLLYFANFQRFIAEAIARSSLDIERFGRMEIFFFGNIQAGEDIVVRLQNASDADVLLADVIRSDRKIIATARIYRAGQKEDGPHATHLL